MSTYFKVVNLDKKEQASLVIHKSESEVAQTIEEWESQTGKLWFDATFDEIIASGRRVCDPDGFEDQKDGSWTYEVGSAFQNYNDKLVLGFILMEACGDQWGHTTPWFGDRIVVVSDGYGSKELYDGHSFDDIYETFKRVKFHISYENWNAAIAPFKK
ncbi:hypothetical protein [Burkholderia cenocepacia]|uniref:hypothetical protein n=1 Tax=Burkholderia cenocepacia TaxID=95486 RepID=UPI0022313C11|nr:hypothetical protein [Burkholderia cenocepacia]MCW3498733.1 hypothetical protein [Burkholderia cenocepacia]MCW3506179.1 hypothetical protein [Burkholderia cenocepacia]MCW3513886.1 hypothetical protein [Burkholderia cenocepacia]MCW3529036.1 hypothetical protein [Burkholderia cenocepacia]MCW3544630.1 hypothetical protein [Burkholderia cenocepacia]